MLHKFILNGITHEINAEFVGIINGKIITAKTFPQLKRIASIEANKRYSPYDELLVLMRNGVEPLRLYRFNKKSPNNEIIRGKW